MTLGDLTTLRERLGGRRGGKLLIGAKYASALKKAAGFHGTRFFDVDAVIVWRAMNPEFKQSDVYPVQSPACNRKGRRVATAGKSNGS